MTPLLEVDGVSVHFRTEHGSLRAVDAATLHVGAGETVALVGESGSGKSTLARAILGLVTPTSGTMKFGGEPLEPLGRPSRRRFFQRIQMIFQDPDASLNPRLTVGTSIGEALELGSGSGERSDRIATLMHDVGLSPELGVRYPHELSGGQKQRICIARALAGKPELVVCDEAVSALDVSIQAQILNLLVELREKFSLSYLFITHDLRVVRFVSHRVAVLYLGQIVEVGDTASVFEAPAHPYTRALLAAVPIVDGQKRARPVAVRGEIPSPIRPPSGCRFHTRCLEVFDRCPREAPQLYSIGKGRESRCFLSVANSSGYSDGA
jgi:oligopeptide/dipeptide ABC transporter ATP-binding protein